MRERSEEEDREHQALMKQVEEWDQERHETPKEFMAFLEKLKAYPRSYSSCPSIVGAAATAAARFMDRWGDVGLTGFQAGFVMWHFIQKWMGIEGHIRLVKYEEMLYPQYEQTFEKSIPADTWAWLQDRAKDKLADWDRRQAEDPELVGSSVVRDHWQSIVEGKVPFGYVVKDRR